MEYADATHKLKQLLAADKPFFGLWSALGAANSIELCATTGFDWILIDAEHGPNDVPLVLEQLRAIAAYPVVPVVRPPNLEPSLIKRYLDLGATNLLAPMVNDAETAASLVRATRYPPKGERGFGSGLARVSRWTSRSDYISVADDEITLIVQIESAEALENVENICQVDGVDAVFFGPADIAASIGKIGKFSDPEVVDRTISAAKKATALKVPSGIYTADAAFLAEAVKAGVRMLGVASDTGLLAEAAKSSVKNARDKFDIKT